MYGNEEKNKKEKKNAEQLVNCMCIGDSICAAEAVEAAAAPPPTVRTRVYGAYNRRRRYSLYVCRKYMHSTTRVI